MIIIKNIWKTNLIQIYLSLNKVIKIPIVTIVVLLIWLKNEEYYKLRKYKFFLKLTIEMEKAVIKFDNI